MKSGENKMNKIDELAKIEGWPSWEQMVEHYIYDSVCPAICTEPGCHFTAHYEPDCSEGYCQFCGKQTVSSALVLLGMI